MWHGSLILEVEDECIWYRLFERSNFFFKQLLSAYDALLISNSDYTLFFWICTNVTPCFYDVQHTRLKKRQRTWRKMVSTFAVDLAAFGTRKKILFFCLISLSFRCQQKMRLNTSNLSSFQRFVQVNLRKLLILFIFLIWNYCRQTVMLYFNTR